jgi:hypothetical protein
VLPLLLIVSFLRFPSKVVNNHANSRDHDRLFLSLKQPMIEVLIPGIRQMSIQMVFRSRSSAKRSRSTIYLGIRLSSVQRSTVLALKSLVSAELSIRKN